MKKFFITTCIIMIQFIILSQVKTTTDNNTKKTVTPQKKDSDKIKPTIFVATVKIFSAKNYDYYALSAKKKTVLNVNGPGKVEVLLRVRLENGIQNSESYFISYMIDNQKIQTVKIESEKVSKKTIYKSKITGIPSEASTITIDVPPGKHKISFLKDNKTEQKIHAHFSLKKETKPVWIECTSLTKLDTVKVKYLELKGEIKKYVRISNTEKLIIETKDSIQLKIIIKAELDNTTQSNNPIHLVMKENNTIINTYKIEGKKSSTTEYVDEKKMIPGNSNVIYITVPSGEHSYEFYIEDKNKTALILIYSNKFTKNKL